MTSDTPVYIAGVGYSKTDSKSGSSQNKDALTTALISAATKALLDAGVSYDDITHAISCTNTGNPSVGRRALDALGQTGIPIGTETDRATCLSRATNLITKDGAQSVLILGVENNAAASLILISEAFFWHHPYLKDAAVVLKDSKSVGSSFLEICQTVWTLRGWSSSQNKSSDGLSRADGNSPPKPKDVEFKNDGRQRLSYNPAKDSKEISLEDWEAVRSKRKGADKKAPGNLDKVFKRRGGDRAMLESKL